MNTDGVIHVKMPDNTWWEIPVTIIAMNRARNYIHEFAGNIVRSLEEDTIPLFNEDSYEIVDWAMNNMRWSELAPFAKLIRRDEIDYDEAWPSGAEVKVIS